MPRNPNLGGLKKVGVGLALLTGSVACREAPDTPPIPRLTTAESASPPVRLPPVLGILQERDGKRMVDGCFKWQAADGSKHMGVFTDTAFPREPSAQILGRFAAVNGNAPGLGRFWTIGLQDFNKDHLHLPPGGTYRNPVANVEVKCSEELPAQMTLPPHSLGQLAHIERNQDRSITKVQAPINETTRLQVVTDTCGNYFTDLPAVGTVRVEESTMPGMPTGGTAC